VKKYDYRVVLPSTLGAGNFSARSRESSNESKRSGVAGEAGIGEQARDEVLLRKAGKGDEDAFVVLYRRHQAALYRYAFRMTSNAWGAEEVVQDVFMTLMKEPKKFDASRGTVGAFLFGIARNRVMKLLERMPREVSLEEKNGDSGRPELTLQESFTPAMWVEKKQRSERVRAAVMELPPEFRETVVLCELEEMSYEQAAEMIGCPVGTIRSRLHRGRALLLAKLEMLRDVPQRATAAR
jgi:RNA polymerase sigma-70 factor, ECF subfamily